VRILKRQKIEAAKRHRAGPMVGPDGKEIPPTGKSFEVDFCTVARWDENGQIVEENLFYDVVGMMKQIGLG
jgi:hypothetical protein